MMENKEWKIIDDNNEVLHEGDLDTMKLGVFVMTNDKEDIKEFLKLTDCAVTNLKNRFSCNYSGELKICKFVLDSPKEIKLYISIENNKVKCVDVTNGE